MIDIQILRENPEKAKQGFVVVRQRVMRGGHQRETINAGRRTKRRGSRKNLIKSYQSVAEERANREFTNLEVLNSYFVAKDKNYFWYEVILVDPNHPRTSKDFAWMRTNPKRVMHGKTSAGRKSRIVN